MDTRNKTIQYVRRHSSRRGVDVVRSAVCGAELRLCCCEPLAGTHTHTLTPKCECIHAITRAGHRSVPESTGEQNKSINLAEIYAHTCCRSIVSPVRARIPCVDFRCQAPCDSFMYTYHTQTHTHTLARACTYTEFLRKPSVQRAEVITFYYYYANRIA